MFLLVNIMAIFIQWLVLLLPDVDTTSEQSFWLCSFVDCSIEKQISDTMKKAFWDSLQEKLSSQPPDYSHALVLIEEVREVRIITVINFNSVMTWRTYCLVNQPSLVRILSTDGQYFYLDWIVFCWVNYHPQQLWTIKIYLFYEKSLYSWQNLRTPPISSSSITIHLPLLEWKILINAKSGRWEMVLCNKINHCVPSEYTK